MRDRLIELFEAVEKDPAITCPHYKTDKTCDTCKYTINEAMCNHIERTVDYLLANGVIIPIRCKDCMFYNHTEIGDCMACVRQTAYKKPNDFCSCAKLKEREKV